MRERDRYALREWREEEERSKKEEIEKHASQLRATHKKLLETNRKVFLFTKDPELYVSPYLENARWTLEQAIAFNKEQAGAFVAETPEYFACMENFELLSDYFARNLTEIVDKQMWSVAYRKALDLGLLKTGPDPEAEPIREAQPEPELEILPANTLRAVAHKVEAQGNMYGRDLKTGEIRIFTDHELSQLTADQYRKVLQIPSIDNMQIPVR